MFPNCSTLLEKSRDSFFRNRTELRCEARGGLVWWLIRKQRDRRFFSHWLLLRSDTWPKRRFSDGAVYAESINNSLERYSCHKVLIEFRVKSFSFRHKSDIDSARRTMTVIVMSIHNFTIHFSLKMPVMDCPNCCHIALTFRVAISCLSVFFAFITFSSYLLQLLYTLSCLLNTLHPNNFFDRINGQNLFKIVDEFYREEEIEYKSWKNLI